MIDRGTFYRYYKSKYHLVEKIFSAALKKMDTDIGHFPALSDIADLDAILGDRKTEAAWVSLFEHFASNSRMYTALLGGKGSAWFQARMREHFMQYFKGKVPYSGPDAKVIPVNVVRWFLSSALVGVIHLWLDRGMEFSAFQVASWFRRIEYKGYVAPLTGVNG